MGGSNKSGERLLQHDEKIACTELIEKKYITKLLGAPRYFRSRKIVIVFVRIDMEYSMLQSAADYMMNTVFPYNKCKQNGLLRSNNDLAMFFANEMLHMNKVCESFSGTLGLKCARYETSRTP